MKKTIVTTMLVGFGTVGSQASTIYEEKFRDYEALDPLIYTAVGSSAEFGVNYLVNGLDVDGNKWASKGSDKEVIDFSGNNNLKFGVTEEGYTRAIFTTIDLSEASAGAYTLTYDIGMFRMTEGLAYWSVYEGSNLNVAGSAASNGTLFADVSNKDGSRSPTFTG